MLFRSQVLKFGIQILLRFCLGTQYSMKEYDYTATKALNILPSLNIINGIGEITLRNTKNEGPSRYQEALLSYFARLNYNYKSKYLLEGNFRYDGSSKFQPENRWAFFGGVSGGWRISEEEFVKGLGVFDDLRMVLAVPPSVCSSGSQRSSVWFIAVQLQ